MLITLVGFGVGVMEERMLNPQGRSLSQEEEGTGETLYKHPRSGNSNDQAHPPIHPVKTFPGAKEGDDFKVYDLICRHFLACCSKDAIYQETEVELTIEEEKFHLKGIRTIQNNFLEIYKKFIYHKEKEIPEFYEGQEVHPSEILLKEGLTSPPKLLGEADLIGLMDKFGIGTDATIHDHIKTILSRKYAIKTR